MEISDLDEMLHTCNKIEIPPNPNKNAAIITFIPSLAETVILTKLRPEVSSIIPDKIATIKLVFIFIERHNGSNNFKAI